MSIAIADSWTELDLDAMGAKARLIGFDLDNTLARSKMPMHDDMASALAALTHLTQVAVISGGRYELFVRQILTVDAFRGDAAYANLHLMPTSGTRYYRFEDGGWRLQYEQDLPEADRMAARESLERHARELGLWEAHTWGERIEDRGSQVTFSALGQQAPVDAKEAWDPDNAKKNALRVAVAADLPHLLVRSGGATSVDVSGRGIDKGYAVRELARILGIGVGDIIFIGDRMDPNGNDYPAAQAGVMPVRVHGPEETLEVVRRLTGILRG
ncbi:HAD-IIB family hydrolase [Bifidobacterium avesanii]|uniref:phosphomannomutase n=1 Tax=Bifidobacterium avesanii TaxID=1798157 RepID=A0A7K3TGX9_9BIFI|nr:HAD-IIB family hydrolase [Bifidobacterium avesanii]KAB8292740.1 HAD family hydrolase [Bifidobacterium avesanii]NEG78348.1 HAD-IIB family hydrolase [Bifidobacterium avesanii]